MFNRFGLNSSLCFVILHLIKWIFASTILKIFLFKSLFFARISIEFEFSNEFSWTYHFILHFHLSFHIWLSEFSSSKTVKFSDWNRNFSPTFTCIWMFNRVKLNSSLCSVISYLINGNLSFLNYQILKVFTLKLIFFSSISTWIWDLQSTRIEFYIFLSFHIW